MLRYSENNLSKCDNVLNENFTENDLTYLLQIFSERIEMYEFFTMSIIHVLSSVLGIVEIHL